MSISNLQTLRTWVIARGSEDPSKTRNINYISYIPSGSMQIAPAFSSKVQNRSPGKIQEVQLTNKLDDQPLIHDWWGSAPKIIRKPDVQKSSQDIFFCGDNHLEPKVCLLGISQVAIPKNLKMNSQRLPLLTVYRREFLMTSVVRFMGFLTRFVGEGNLCVFGAPSPGHLMHPSERFQVNSILN